ncbi:MAG: gamma-glutamyl-gamma-aminobutyrate hydrolase family protein, partial [Tissierellia bacterium]|nr:gamma-glutamyl-gamma-aminobutyrate hydrolase family protein [Tissierellia bacterium]
MKPIIGISSYEENHKGQYNLNINYVDAVLDAGGIPVIIPIIRDEEDAERYLDTIDGIIFSGGIDISPLNYDENPLKEINRISSVRDNYEMMLFKKAYKRKMPILGICRGSQLMNVALGGKLYQDINTQAPNSLGHSPSSMAGDEFFHSIKIEKDSNFYNIFGKEKIFVNSFHHQAVKELGNNLKAVAHAEDGIIEAIEATDE